jgi:para-aminobenzoate synthetase component 1
VSLTCIAVDNLREGAQIIGPPEPCQRGPQSIAMPHRLLEPGCTTLDLFARLRDLPCPALLQSHGLDHPESAIDVLAADPAMLVTYAGGVLKVGPRTLATADPVRALKHALPVTDHHTTFRHGFIGAFGYDLAVDRRPGQRRPPDPTPLPAIAGGVYDWSIVVDHRRRETRLHWRDGTATHRLDAVLERLHRPAPPLRSFRVGSSFDSEWSLDDYARAFDRVQAYLAAGDCYQVNLARHFSAAITGDERDAAWAIYRATVAAQGGPFCAYVESPLATVMSLSPERLLRFAPDGAVTMPIKGTAPRGRSACEDAERALALAGSAKDRAENLMIVDLMRNDLGRFCEPGSIRAPRLFEVQRFANVHHLVSTVRGQPRADVDALDALAALLPPGSVTGCPKRRAIEIIDELEPVGRSAYCGAIGYIDAGGLMDVNVAIRTLVVGAGRVHCWGGGGLVADSRLEDEWAEIEHKIGRLLQVAVDLPDSRSASAE